MRLDKKRNILKLFKRWYKTDLEKLNKKMNKNNFKLKRKEDKKWMLVLLGD